MLPHSDFGDPECCGCLYGIVRGGEAEIACNECGLVIRTVPAADLQRTLDDMELTLSLYNELCPKCGKVNLFPGYSRMVLYTCRECGEAIVCLNAGVARKGGVRFVRECKVSCPVPCPPRHPASGCTGTPGSPPGRDGVRQG